jgi:tryptophan 2,3-dioxygenase
VTDTPRPLTYGSYLALDQLLSAQHPHSPLHDEMLFIIIHQTKELWLKQAVAELKLSRDLIRQDRLIQVHKSLSRVSRIQAVMTLSWDVLATMTPTDYSSFRDVLGSSSGFQSAQFREVEYLLGLKDSGHLKFQEEASQSWIDLDRALSEPSLWDEANAALARAGPLVAALHAGGKARRHRRFVRDLAAQACGDGVANHRDEARHRRHRRRVLSSVDAGEACLSGALVAEDADLAHSPIAEAGNDLADQPLARF